MDPVLTESVVLEAGGFRTRVNRFYRNRPARNATIVLVHDGAFGSDASLCWGTVGPALAMNYDVVAPDLLGYGRASKVYDFGEGPYVTRIRHLGAVCDALGIDCAHFVGASFGASLLLVATHMNALPMKSCTAICGAGGLYRQQERFADLYELEPTRNCARKITNYLVGEDARWSSLVETRYQNMFIPGHWECLEAAKLPAATKTEARARIDVRDALRRSDTPVLFVEGRDDMLLEAGWAERLAAAAARGLSRTVPGRHLPHVAHPQPLVSLINEFVAVKGSWRD